MDGRKFEDAKRLSLDLHRTRGTPESEAGADVVRELAAAMHRLRACDVSSFAGRIDAWALALEFLRDGVIEAVDLHDARMALGQERCRWMYEAERARLAGGECTKQGWLSCNTRGV